MIETDMQKRDEQSLDEYVWRLGSLKMQKQIESTWDELADIFNEALDTEHDESFWRKRYKKLAKAIAIAQLPATLQRDFEQEMKNSFVELEKQRARIRQERSAYSAKLRQDARLDDFLDLFQQGIERIEPIKFERNGDVERTDKALYAMLSDVHYGLSFRNPYSQYNTEIAKQRVMKYADRLIQIGEEQGLSTVYVSVMGDMISGIIHQTIRIENRQNLIGQIFGVSELTTCFLAKLAASFSEVHVNCVSGNHSRVDTFENALRGERLDAIIPWYCKARLEAFENVTFHENQYDETFAVHEIFGKTYVSVHGDLDTDMANSARRISQLIGEKIDYFLAGHMHVADMRIEDTGFIRNGAVVSGGDEYTAKKRLFGPAVQVCMTVTPDGVQAIYPVTL